MDESVKGQVVKVQTTADQCVRITIDVENHFIPEGLNILKWKNEMVKINLIMEVENGRTKGGPQTPSDPLASTSRRS
jgi:hypothetical protein